jgi:hypothetical protein
MLKRGNLGGGVRVRVCVVHRDRAVAQVTLPTSAYTLHCTILTQFCCPLHIYTTLHYTTYILHYTTLHYTAPHSLSSVVHEHLSQLRHSRRIPCQSHCLRYVCLWALGDELGVLHTCGDEEAPCEWWCSEWCGE